MQLTDYIILFSSVTLGGLSFFLVKNPRPDFLKIVLSFSGAFLFALSVLHLMPTVYDHAPANIGAWIMLGFFLQVILELFSEGIEHGHMHIHHHHNSVFPAGMMISLCLHSFLEAIPLSMGAMEVHGHAHTGSSLLAGIALHHIPVAFALVSMLIASGVSRSNTLLLLLVFALMGPLGAWSGEIFGIGSQEEFSGWYKRIMAVVIGIFLHISTTILFESGSGHRFNLYKMAAIITGGLAGLLAI